MARIVITLSRPVKRRFRRMISKTRDARVRTRYLIVLHTADGRSRRQIARLLVCSPATVDRIRHRYVEQGEGGLVDRRGDSGSAKVTDDYILELLQIVRGSPLDYGHRRPT